MIISFKNLFFLTTLSLGLLAQAQLPYKPGPNQPPGLGINLEPIDQLQSSDRAERLRRMAQRLSQQIDQKVNSMNDDEITQVIQLLKSAGEIVKSSGNNGMPELVDAETVVVSRKKGGEWITLKYDQAVEILQLNFRSIGAGSVKVYAVHLVSTNGQSTKLDSTTILLPSNSVKAIQSNISGYITHVQVLAEAFQTPMSMTIESYSFASDNGQVGPPPPPPPVYPPTQPPVQYGPKCELYGSGAFAGYSYSYRGGYNGEAKFGTDNFDDLLEKLSKLRSAGLCQYTTEEVCTLPGSGSFSGYSYNYRIQVGEKVISATDDQTILFNQMKKLSGQGLCAQSYERCDLLGSGSFAGYSYNQRVAVGNKVVHGTDNQDNAIEFIQQLRQAGACK